jgi:hypothetical protein
MKGHDRRDSQRNREFSRIFIDEAARLCSTRKSAGRSRSRSSPDGLLKRNMQRLSSTVPGLHSDVCIAHFMPSFDFVLSKQSPIPICALRRRLNDVSHETATRSLHQGHRHTGRLRIPCVSRGSSAWPAVDWAFLMKQCRDPTTAA